MIAAPLESRPAARSAAELFADLEAELAATRQVLERFPVDNPEWRPHAKSMTVSAMAEHVADIPRFATVMLRGPVLDFATEYFAPAGFTTKEALLSFFEQRAGELRNALADADDATLARPCTLQFGEHPIRTDVTGNLVRGMLNHLVHHRGQLCVYYRLLDIPVPGLYGPSADEPFM